MVTDPVVMVISIRITNKESGTLSTAPASNCRKILVHQKPIPIYNVLRPNNELWIKIVDFLNLHVEPFYSIFQCKIKCNDIHNFIIFFCIANLFSANNVIHF